MNARKVMTHRFDGVLFFVGVSDALSKIKALGLTTSRRARLPAIVFDPKLGGRQALETLIHESLHAIFDKKLSERQVENAGRDIAGFLWRLGYRVDEKKRRAAK